MKNRNEIEEKYTWDLSKIYQSTKEFNEDYNKVSIEIDNIKKYEKDMISSGITLYNTLVQKTKIERILSKLFTYSMLLFDQDTSINKNQELKDRVSNLGDKYNKNSYFIEPKILKLDKNILNKYYQECPKLEEYKIELNEICKYKNHTLSDEEEQLLSSISKMEGNNYDIYELLKETDMPFNNITIDNKEVEINDNSYSIYIENKDRNIRKDAFNSLYKTYSKYENTYSKILESFIKEQVTISRIRKYPSAIESSLYSEDIDIEVFNNLINSVSNNLDKLYKYYNLKKKILDLDELHIYDMNLPLLKDLDIKYDYETAKVNVINALNVLGKEYIDVLKTTFIDRWIDVYPTKSKRTGGYSGGSYDTYPYILLNYQNKFDDMSTLAHELGHSMHSYYARSNNPYQYGDYSIFVAEVASTVNELLLSKYMLKNSKNKEEKLFIINRLLETFKAAIYRQTMFSEFEKEIYSLVEEDIPLTSDRLCNMYYELNKKYFGNDIIIDEPIKYEWIRIPHFYYNFYVYKYATGLSSACYIVNNVIEKGKVEDYLNFLKCGSTLNPIESLKLTGVDITKKEVVESALNMFNDLVIEFEDLYYNK